LRAWSVLLHQLRFPLLGLLVVAAVASYPVGERCAWATSSRPTSGCWRSADWSAASRCWPVNRWPSTNPEGQ